MKKMKKMLTAGAVIVLAMVFAADGLAERKKGEKKTTTETIEVTVAEEDQPQLPPVEQAGARTDPGDNQIVFERIWTNKSKCLGKIRMTAASAEVCPDLLVGKKTALGKKPVDSNECIDLNTWRPMIDGRIGKRIAYNKLEGLVWETDECNLCELYESNPGMFLSGKWRRYVNLDAVTLLCDGKECGDLLHYRTEEMADQAKREGHPGQEVGAGYVNWGEGNAGDKRRGS